MANDDAEKFLRSRGGLKITLHETAGKESFAVETSGGQKFLLQNGPGAIEIDDGNGNSVKLEPDGITVNASAKVTINASVVEISAGMLNINAGISKFNGEVQCNTLISNSVVSASYTPGAGNLW